MGAREGRNQSTFIYALFMSVLSPVSVDITSTLARLAYAFYFFVDWPTSPRHLLCIRREGATTTWLTGTLHADFVKHNVVVSSSQPALFSI